MYVTDTPGAIRQFEFVDASHVNVWWSSCADGKPCEANDTYAIDGSELTIHDPGGNVTTMQLSALQSGVGTAYPLHGLDTGDPGSLNSGDGGTLVAGDGGSLATGDGGGLTSGQTITIVIQFQITIVVQAGSALVPTSEAGALVGGDGGTRSDAGVGLVTCTGTALTQTFHRANVFPNDQQAFDFFRARGLSAAQAAGIVGNLDQESTNSPTCYQGPRGCASTPQAGYPGAGIAQWSMGDRYDTRSNDNLTWYAAQIGEPATSLDAQLQFIWYELTHFSTYGLSQLQQQTTAAGASDVFQTAFERCGNCVQGNREQDAQNAYTAFANDSVEAGTEGGVCAQSFGACTASMKTGSCVDTGVCATSNGMSTAGVCPGPSNIQCCTM